MTAAQEFTMASFNTAREFHTEILNNEDLETIRTTVPHLDLMAIRSLRRAGFDIVRRPAEAGEPVAAEGIPLPMTRRAPEPAL